MITFHFINVTVLRMYGPLCSTPWNHLCPSCPTASGAPLLADVQLVWLMGDTGIDSRD